MSISYPSFAAEVERLMLGCYNGELCNLKPEFKTIEEQVFSRALGLLISPAAALDLAVNVVTCCVPGHVQKIRDAVFPLLFGSVFGLVHPYLGTYAAEPVKKHIATGILLSGTTRGFDAIVSPVTAMEEIASLGREISDSVGLSENEERIIKQAVAYEIEFEKIQSLDFFNLDLTGKLGAKLIQKIEEMQWSSPLTELANRAVAVVYPILALCDFSVMAFTTSICIGTLIVKVLGGQSSAYLETASSPELLLYNIVKIPLFLVSMVCGLAISLVDPKKGIGFPSNIIHSITQMLFQQKMNAIARDLQRMAVGEHLLIPAVEVNPENKNDELGLVPTYHSHMRYILIEKIDEEQYEAELIERRMRHGKTDRLPREEMQKLLSNTLSLRFDFAYRDNMFDLSADFWDHTGIVELGEQAALSNCVIRTVAAIQVLRYREGRNDFNAFCDAVKKQAIERYAHYLNDFYPFGAGSEILQEIEQVSHQVV